MKNHISEIEIALSKNKQKNSAPIHAVNASTAADMKNGSKMDSVSSTKVESNRRTSERPKRASTAKFHEMMKFAFGADHDFATSPNKTTLQTEFVSDTEDSNIIPPLILTEVDENTLLVKTVEEEDPVQTVLSEDGVGEEELVVVEPDRSTWHAVDNEITLTTIDEDAAQEVRSITNHYDICIYAYTWA